MKLTKSHRDPTTRERATLTRIYGSEENWNGVATSESKKRRAEKLTRRRNGCD
jgi:hypothetical protein